MNRKSKKQIPTIIILIVLVVISGCKHSSQSISEVDSFLLENHLHRSDSSIGLLSTNMNDSLLYHLYLGRGNSVSLLDYDSDGTVDLIFVIKDLDLTEIFIRKEANFQLVKKDLLIRMQNATNVECWGWAENPDDVLLEIMGKTNSNHH